MNQHPELFAAAVAQVRNGSVFLLKDGRRVCGCGSKVFVFVFCFGCVFSHGNMFTIYTDDSVGAVLP